MVGENGVVQYGIASTERTERAASSADPIIPVDVMLTQALHALYGSCRFFNDRPPSAFGFGRNYAMYAFTYASVNIPSLSEARYHSQPVLYVRAILSMDNV
jgi:hypothetical protein